MKNWNIHNCAHDADCREVDPNPPNRLYINSPYGSIIVALDRDSWTQAWLPFKGYTKWWWPIVFHKSTKQ